MKLKYSLNQFSLSRCSIILGGIILLVFPLIFRQGLYPFIVNTVIWTLFYAYLSSSWNISAGFAGILSFGHVVFFGIGAYTTAIAYATWGLSPWIGMWIGVGLSILASFIIGWSSLRLKGIYFVMLTLVFLLVSQTVVVYWRDVTGGSLGMRYDPVPFSFWDFQFSTDKTPYYYIIFGMLLTVLFLSRKLKSSKWGLYFMAIREDEELAEVSGIDVSRYKVVSILISSALTSLGGSFYAQFTLSLYPFSVFSINRMLQIITPSVVGGLGTVMGPTIGAFALLPIGEILRVQFGYIPGVHLLLYGVFLIAFTLIGSDIMTILLGKRGS